METYHIHNYVQKHLSGGTRVLLINAPVIETRYQWVRWNQPLDLLKIGAFLRQEPDCDVRLFDFMLPQKRKVLRTGNRNDKEIKVDGYVYPLWRYGKPFDELVKWLKSPEDHWFPDEVWISTLTSYWWKGIHSTISQIKNRWPDLKICLYGLYPTLETDHARGNSFADILLTGKLDLEKYLAAFDLYGGEKLDFRALDLRSPHWPNQVLEGLEAGVSDYVFFNDNVLEGAEEFLLGGLRTVREKVRSGRKCWCRFHGLCGIDPRFFTRELAKELFESGFVSLHFEHTRNGERLNLDVYRRVKDAYEAAGVSLDPDQFSGFINIGLADDDLETIITEMLNLHEIFATVILKPYTPTPGSKDHDRYRERLPVMEIEKLSPHCFPLASVSGISHGEYEELYALAAMLNHKVKSKGFDHFPGTLAYEMIRTSFEREVWKLGESQSLTN